MLALLASQTAIAAAAPSLPAASGESDRDRRLAEAKRIAEGEAARGTADASASARRGEFGMIMLGHRASAYFANLPGLVCHTPYGSPPPRRPTTNHGSATALPPLSATFAYGKAYNRTLADLPAYPDRDLCRLRGDFERSDLTETSVMEPVRPAGRPPRTIFEAARYGSDRDVRRLATGVSIDAIDGYKMTALAWAVVRDNAPAITALLAHGADPWGAAAARRTPIYWAARLGRPLVFDRLLASARARSDPWSEYEVRAAAFGGNQTILTHILREPHARLALDNSEQGLPPIASMAQLLADDPSLADPMLEIGIRKNDLDIAYIRMVLSAAADPNRLGTSRETPLGYVLVSNYGPRRTEAARLLLVAGADPNLLSAGRRPVAIALRFSGVFQEAAAILDMLLVKGADPNLPDADGVPTIRQLLFPLGDGREEFRPWTITPADLERFASLGVNLNAQWRGRRVLGLVEAQTGPDSVWSRTLRRLGAKP